MRASRSHRQSGEYQPARLEEELSDLIYYTVDASTPTPRLTIQSEGTRISRAYGHTGKGVLLDEYIGPDSCLS